MTNVIFDEMEAALLRLLDRAVAVAQNAGVPYRVTGEVAVYLHVATAEEGAGRLTPHVDIAIRREDLDAFIRAARTAGFEDRGTLLVDHARPKSRRSVRLVFASLDVPPVYVRGYPLMPVPQIVTAALTSYRTIDRVNIRDMDEVGLTTEEIAASLPD